MAEIIPAILPKKVSDIRNQVAIVMEKTKMIQIDLVDGIFATNKTWPYNGEDSEFLTSLEQESEGMPFWQDMNYELDLMVKDAHQNLDYFYRFAPARIILHAEAEGDAGEFADFLEAIDPFFRDAIEIGIAFNIDSKIENYREVLKGADFVQCMGIANIGRQGEEFDERVFEQIKIIKKEFDGLPISVDGGVNLDNAKSLIDAGVDRLVVGSAIWKSANPLETLKYLRSL